MDRTADRQESGEAPTDTNLNIEGAATATEAGETTAEATVHAEGAELERTIGLTGGLAIGVGTMAGAGIFAVPGPAADDGG